MKRNAFISTAMFAMVALSACGRAAADPIQAVSANRSAAPSKANEKIPSALPQTDPAVPGALIQVALLLDTSNSMDGLIDQAKAQLWRIVNESVKAQKGDTYAVLQVALYEYGNTGLSERKGFIRQVLPFTEDLDRISEALFALNTNGGDEYCGQVTLQAVNELAWSNAPGTLKVIYIAGNEEYTQGPVPFKKSGAAAREKRVLINTIHCGDYETGRQGEWHMGAKSAGGVYANIDQNKQPVSIDAPQDDELIALNAKLNATYISFGAAGKRAAARQAAQDANASSVSKSVAAKRAVSKAGRLYNNSSWDLVDAAKQGKIDYNKIDRKHLPDALKGKSADEIEAYVMQKQKEREDIQKRIAALEKERAAYVAAELAKQNEKGADTLDDVIVATLRKQAEAEGFTFSEM